MKFRHFEFKLFPKLKTKKKKKTPKLCNPDFPRDIGLDKNFNYSKTCFQGYYDNLGADDNFLARQFITAQDANFGNSRYRTYPLPELKIEVGSLCQCPKCVDSCQSPDHRSTWICVSAPEEDQTGSDVSVGTPNTIPRTRTRIKTNPWLPSPRTTPSPSSPSDTADSILYSSSEFNGSTKSCPITLSRSRDENSPFHWTCGNSSKSYAPSSRSDGNGFHNLVKIAELEHDSTEEDDMSNAPTSITTEVIRIRGTQSIEQMTLDFIKETETLSNHSADSNRTKRFSFTEFLKYDTDGSACNSPVVETIEFLSTIKYDVGFDYEDRVDELLETSDFPRDATFVSIKELLEETDDIDTHQEDNGTEGDYDGKVTLSEPGERHYNTKPDSPDYSDSLSLNEKDSGLEKGYVSSTEDMMDDNMDDNLDDNLGDNMNDNIGDSLDNSNSFSNMDLTCYEERNMQESIDTGYASVTRDTDSMSSRDDVCTSSDLDLEWDNDPVTHHLTLDFRSTESSSSSESLKQLQRPRSRSLDHGCACNKRRSRSLADIETSLDEKVTRLREEKLYVQRKIREAIEEEQIRHQQLKYFRSLSPVDRKEMLVRTLHDLKTRLEHQSARLQASYDMVLSLQQRYTQRRNTVPAIESRLLAH